MSNYSVHCSSIYMCNFTHNMHYDGTMAFHTMHTILACILVMVLQYFSYYKGFLILTGYSTDTNYDYSIREYSSSIVLRINVKTMAKHMHKYKRILFINCSM